VLIEDLRCESVIDLLSVEAVIVILSISFANVLLGNARMYINNI